MMKYKALVLVLTSFFLISCGSSPKRIQVDQRKAEVPKLDVSQDIVNELKNGLAIYFEKNSTEISQKYDLYLTSAAKILAYSPNYILQLEGHTDSSGTSAINQRVSTTRAEVVRNILVVQYGVNPSQITAIGVGPAKPIASNATEDGRKLNRRVSMTLAVK